MKKFENWLQKGSNWFFLLLVIVAFACVSVVLGQSPNNKTQGDFPIIEKQTFDYSQPEIRQPQPNATWGLLADFGTMGGVFAGLLYVLRLMAAENQKRADQQLEMINGFKEALNNNTNTINAYSKAEEQREQKLDSFKQQTEQKLDKIERKLDDLKNLQNPQN
jgi:hypothetical protein